MLVPFCLFFFFLAFLSDIEEKNKVPILDRTWTSRMVSSALDPSGKTWRPLVILRRFLSKHNYVIQRGRALWKFPAGMDMVFNPFAPLCRPVIINIILDCFNCGPLPGEHMLARAAHCMSYYMSAVNLGMGVSFSSFVQLIHFCFG